MKAIALLHMYSHSLYTNSHRDIYVSETNLMKGCDFSLALHVVHAQQALSILLLGRLPLSYYLW